MQSPHQVSNPFALLLNPEAVHAAMQNSARLNTLRSKIWRPLDQPIIPKTEAEVREFDQSIDAIADTDIVTTYGDLLEPR